MIPSHGRNQSVHRIAQSHGRTEFPISPALPVQHFFHPRPRAVLDPFYSRHRVLLYYTVLTARLRGGDELRKVARLHVPLGPPQRSFKFLGSPGFHRESCRGNCRIVSCGKKEFLFETEILRQRFSAIKPYPWSRLLL